jgi:hypothetical protein
MCHLSCSASTRQELCLNTKHTTPELILVLHTLTAGYGGAGDFKERLAKRALAEPLMSVETRMLDGGVGFIC